MENDRISFLAYAEEEGLKRGMERGMEQGMKEGMKEGMKQGIEQGIEQGLEQGLKEGIKQGKHSSAIEIAKKLLENNISLDVIKNSTGLSDEELSKII